MTSKPTKPAIYHRPRVFCWLDTETTGVGSLDVPIQVGLIITDEYLNPLGEDEFLVKISDTVKGNFIDNQGQWTTRVAGAFAVHKIPASVVETGLHPATAVARLIERLRPHQTEKERPILVSDNPVLDERMIRTLFWQAGIRRDSQWPFHYSAWSPIMLHTALGLGKFTKPHTALGDVQAMLDRTREALDLIQAFREATATDRIDVGPQLDLVPTELADEAKSTRKKATK